MEAVPRLPMLGFDLKISPDPSSFGPKLKQYIGEVYHEDPESYTNEIRTLEGLRASAVRPVIDVTGCQTLKRYFCQLLFLESRFPMGKGEAVAVTFSWRDIYASMVCTLADVKFELVSILYNIGALHSILGISDLRTTSDGMKMACTHFQCAAWAFQHLRQHFPQPAGVDLAPEVMLYMQEVCLAQAQECILEKSMLDNRKATIIAKLAVKVVDYYNEALHTLQAGGDEGTIAEIVGSRMCKEWTKYLRFKVAYHTCIALLYQGQQAEEQQKMGERVAYYHAASQELENARKLSKGLDQATVIGEALAFTLDVVEGKRKAATNENEFIYHEEVPDRDLLQQVQGVSLVRGIPFSFDDPEVSGPDIFSRLIPMQAHEASSIYSEEKAQLLRQVTSHVEEKDVQLASFLTSMQLEYITQAAQIVLDGVQMTDLPQELVDRAAALSVKPEATKDLVQVMASLANIYHDVESMLEEIRMYLKEEETREKQYQTAVGQRPPSMVATELKREAGKYSEAHQKASESNQTLHRAMMLHVNNLKLLSLPLDELRQHIPTLRVADPKINTEAIKELYMLVNKIDEMRKQRATLVADLRESVAKDDVTEKIVTKLSDDPLDVLFGKEMQKHQHFVKLIEQNLVAQDNILQAMTDAYARHSDTRKLIHELFKQRETTVHALASSYDAYDDLLAKANKGIEFYRKLETNVSKLLQRVKSTCKVQDEERETILAKNKPVPEIPVQESTGPKLKDYLASMKRDAAGVHPPANAYYSTNYGPSASPQPAMGYEQMPVVGIEMPPVVVPSIRPAPVGSEGTNEICTGILPKVDDKNYQRYTNYTPNPQHSYNMSGMYAPTQTPNMITHAENNQMNPTVSSMASGYVYYNNPITYSSGTNQHMQSIAQSNVVPDKSLHERMAALMTKPAEGSVTPAPVSTSAYTPSQVYGSSNNYTATYTNSQQAGASSQANIGPEQNYATGTYYGNMQSISYPPQIYDSSMTSGYGNSQNYSYPAAYAPNTMQNPHYPTATPQYPSMTTQYSSNATDPYSSTNSTQYSSNTAATSVPQTGQYSVANQAMQHPAYVGVTAQCPTTTVAATTVASSNNGTTVPSTQYSATLPAAQNVQNQYISGMQSTGYPTPNDYSSGSYYQYPASTNQHMYPTTTSYTSAPHTTPYSSTMSTQTYAPTGAQYSSASPSPYPNAAPSSTSQYNGTSVNQYSYTNSSQYPPQNPPSQYPPSVQYSNAVSASQYSATVPQTPYSTTSNMSTSIPSQTVTTTTYSYPGTNTATQMYPTNYPQGIQSNQTNQNQAVYPTDYYQQYNNVPISSHSQNASYSGHPGYGYDMATGQYQYTSGIQNSGQAYTAYPPSTSTGHTINNQQLETSTTTMTHYTSAGNYVTKQTESENYGNQHTTQQPGYDQNSGLYYSTPYGYAGQDVLPNNYHMNAPINSNASGQPQSPMTYIHSNNGGMNMANSQPDPSSVSSPQVARKLEEPKSNIDLLADIDFNIPHAPLIPQNESFKDPPKQYTVIEKEIKTTEVTSRPAEKTFDMPQKTNTDFHISRSEFPKIPEPVRYVKKDPLDEPEVLNQFTQEVEKFEKFVEGLISKTLNGPTPLELKWKELQDLQDKDAQHLKISVARCYPSKNRFPDVLPYDHTRVEMPTTKDDYINASHVKDIVSGSPPLILTQTPLQCTFFDFWTMIWEQQCEIILCLLSDSEIQDKYWPSEKGQDLEVGPMRISLVSFNVKPHWIERTLSVCVYESRITRVFIHIQFISWPGSSFPASPGPLLACICEVLSFYHHQRSREHPMVVHCESGVGRSGLVCLLAAYITQPAPLPEILKLVAKMSEQRKQSLRDREHLKFAYQSILYHAQDLLMKRGILTSRSSFEESIKPKTHTRHPSQDLLHGQTQLRELQSNIERMGSGKSAKQ